MDVKLEKASEKDANAIFEIQVNAFKPLLEKYKDYNTNPANESVDRVMMRINYANGGFYKILFKDILVGAMCIFWKEDTQFWISPMFISPGYQGKGIAQKAIALIQVMFPQAVSWELRTIQEEERNCYLYEKMGFKMIGDKRSLNEHSNLIHYKKIC